MDKYEIKFDMDNLYVLYEDNVFIMRGTLENINAYISLKEKGFNITL